jgi:F-type H+-transporting ATPase subunit b
VLIDWFTIVAQIVNFLVLVALLKYFLYDRILGVMDEREKRIASRLEESANVKRQAEAEAEEYREKKRAIESERKKMLAQAKQDADSHRKELLAKARDEVDEAQAKWLASVRREKDTFIVELRRRIGKSSVSVVQSALRDLADTELEQRIIDVFIERLGELTDAQIKEIRESATGVEGKIIIESAFTISPEQRGGIERALLQVIADGFEARFDESPDMICGIAVKFHGHKIAWSIEDYLKTLEESVSRVIDDRFREAARGVGTE